MTRVIRQVFLVVSYGPVIELNIWNFGNPWWSLLILVNPCHSVLRPVMLFRLQLEANASLPRRMLRPSLVKHSLHLAEDLMQRKEIWRSLRAVRKPCAPAFLFRDAGKESVEATVINPLNPCEFLSLGADNEMTTWQDNKVIYIRMDIPHKVKQWIIFIACRKHRCRCKLLQSARFILAFLCALQSCTKHIMPPTAFPRTKKFTGIFNRLSIRTTAKGAFKWVMINYI